MKERRPLLLGPIRIALHQLQHRILHHVQRILPIADAELGDTQGAPLDAGEKPIQGLSVQRVGLRRGFEGRRGAPAAAGRRTLSG